MSETKPGPRELLRIRDFRWIYSGQVVSDLGDSLTIISLLILVQRLGGSELQIAGIIISATLPALLVGLLAGVYVDRWDRRRIMVVSDTIRAVVVLGFVAVRSLDLLWLAYLLAFTQAGIGTMFNPARAALTADVVPERSLLAANSISQTSRIVFHLLGTTAGGVLVGVTGIVWPAFVLDSATFALSAVLISLVAFRSRREQAEATDRKAVWPELRAGLQLLTRSRGMRGLLLAATVALLGLGAVNVLFVPFVVGELGASEAWLGAIEGAQVVAMVIAGAAVAVLSKRLSVNLLTGGGLMIIGIAVAGVVLVHAPWQMMIVLFVAGLGVTPGAGLCRNAGPDTRRTGAHRSVERGAQLHDLGGKRPVNGSRRRFRHGDRHPQRLPPRRRHLRPRRSRRLLAARRRRSPPSPDPRPGHRRRVRSRYARPCDIAGRVAGSTPHIAHSSHLMSVASQASLVVPGT